MLQPQQRTAPLGAPRTPNCFNDHRDEKGTFPLAVTPGVEVAAFEILITNESGLTIDGRPGQDLTAQAACDGEIEASRHSSMPAWYVDICWAPGSVPGDAILWQSTQQGAWHEEVLPLKLGVERRAAA